MSLNLLADTASLKLEYQTMKNEPTVLPGDPAVPCLDVDPGVGHITPHYVVGKVRLQDKEIGIYSNLQDTPQSSSSPVHPSNKYPY